MFLYIARGSAGEVRSILHFLSDWPDVNHLKSQISDLKSLSESCSRQIRAWADSLQNSEIRGPRHLNQTSRKNYDTQRRAAAFHQKIQDSLRADHPEWFPSSDPPPPNS
jgi:hypothetical protein